MRLDELSDEEVALRARTEPQSAFEELFQRHRVSLWNFIRRQGFDAMKAEDLFQTTLLKAFRAISSFREEAKFKSWLYTIAVHVMTDERRGAQKGGNRIELSEDVVGTESGAEDRDRSLDAKDRVGEALSRLDANDRELFTLVRFEGLSVADAARAVGMTHPTARMRLFRAQKRVGERLALHKEKI